jgi:hypothetical protein
MADKKISQLTAKGTPIAATDLVEISESNGAGGYVTKSVTGANILASKQDTLVSGTNIKTINGSSVLGSGNLVVTPGVASLTATAPVVATGTSTPVISLASAYGDTQNPYASKTANHILAAPNGTAGVPTFRAMVASDVPTLNQSTTGNAATVTTNANLTGPVTSIGNATAIANGAISNAMLANGAVANLSGTNTGDNATNSQYSGLVSNATHTGDATGNVGLTVKGINGTILSNLTTGILKNTTGTGVPSIAVAADFPILNQNTTGTAGSTATLATARTISTNGDVLYTSPPFDGSANVLGTATLASIGVAGTYTKVTTDAKGRVTVGANITAGDVPTLNQNTTGTADNVTGIVAVANGGTGTATPSLVAGTNVTITGTFPNQTINSSGGGGGGVTQIVAGTNVTISPAGGTGVVTINSSGGGGGGTEIGALIGGGVVAAVFNQSGVNKALVVSLTNLSTSIIWTTAAFQNTLVPGAGAQSFSDGLINTNAIIAQTGAAATTSYAAGLARLFAGGGFSDWYLPSIWELNMCYNSAAIINRITGVTALGATGYWSSTENGASTAWNLSFGFATFDNTATKNFGRSVRAVRIHTI